MSSSVQIIPVGSVRFSQFNPDVRSDQSLCPAATLIVFVAHETLFRRRITSLSSTITARCAIVIVFQQSYAIDYHLSSIQWIL
eukprot:gene3522-biopygen1952